MSRIINEIAVVGLGKVGELVAKLLTESEFKVVGYDSVPNPSFDFSAEALDIARAVELREVLGSVDAVVSCLPYHLNIGVAEAAHDVGIHYFDLTEDVPTTDRVMELADSSATVFAPQCGLAPGLISIIASSLAQEFDELRSIELKVGALPQNPTGLLGYAFNWSPEGVVNEYLNDCEVLRGGARRMVPAMTEKERVFIGGIEFEAALTSGGLGTLCRTFEGRVDRLDYKTLRYPGHFRQMHFLFDELGLRRERAAAGRLLVAAKPSVNDDIVYLHAAVEGRKGGHALRENYVRAYLPRDIGGRRWRAISWTTAASVVSVIELVADALVASQGFISQESIAFELFCSTKAGACFADAEKV